MIPFCESTDGGDQVIVTADDDTDTARMFSGRPDGTGNRGGD